MVEQPLEFDPLIDELPSRYVVGIDLGTTNSAVAYVDTSKQPWQVRTFSVPQLVAPGEIESRETIPSFHFQPAAEQAPPQSLRLPWSKDAPRYAVGFMARDEGAKSPGRLIASAKSWLSHTGVDRTADLLPWQGASDVDRLSPVEVSARYLLHLRHAWDAQFSDEPLADQDVVITLPASFDEIARELTVEAASRAGLSRVVLIEEPQAAFYAWVHKHADDWHRHLSAGQKILVCDVGGGTSDFTLIRVRRSEAADEGARRVQFHRVAVGNHLVLGGDNLDLALAHHIEKKLTSDGKLTPRQWDVLIRRCRQAKETLLSEGAPDQWTVNLPGEGSKMIGGSLTAELSCEEVAELLVEGFLPRVSLDERPIQRQSGFQEFGLPFAPDPAITRYMAEFLTSHRHDELDEKADAEGKLDSARPDVVLFNGGFFASTILRERTIQVLSSWFRETDPNWQPLVLDNDRLDLAVARGAAYYGMVRRGEGVRIAANLARSYYVSVENDEPSAVCLVPGSAEPGQDVVLDDLRFDLTIAEPVEFPLFVSSTRLSDRPGDLVQIDREQMTPLPPIRTVIKTQRRSERGTVSVNLHSRLTEIGTIDLWCTEVGTKRNWRLQFDIRSATQTDMAAHKPAAEAQGFIEESTWDKCHEAIATVFSEHGEAKPDQLVKQLSQVLDSDRAEWPTSLLRRIWEALMAFESGRRRSPQHESRWLNLSGYALRPGYGLAVDDWRVTQTWRHVYGKLAHGAGSGKTQALILWRRIAGGLSSGQQQALAEPLLPQVRAVHRRFATGKSRAGDVELTASEATETWRLLGSLELLPIQLKIELGDMLSLLITKRKLENVRSPMVWALGRIGQRVPLYGPWNTIVPCDKAVRWMETLLGLTHDDPALNITVMQLSRRTDDRRCDIPDKLRSEVIDWLTARHAPDHTVHLVRHAGQLDSNEQDQVFGEALPKGLRLKR